MARREDARMRGQRLCALQCSISFKYDVSQALPPHRALSGNRAGKQLVLCEVSHLRFGVTVTYDAFL